MQRKQYNTKYSPEFKTVRKYWGNNVVEGNYKNRVKRRLKEENEYLKAEMEYLKKLDALVRAEEQKNGKKRK